MSDHPNEAQRRLRKISLCDDVLFDTFKCMHIDELGFSMALVCDRFDVLVDIHLSRCKRMLFPFIICRGSSAPSMAGGGEAEAEEGCAMVAQIANYKRRTVLRQFPWFVSNSNRNGDQICYEETMRTLPIPQEPLPDHVVGFKHICIQYVDQSVIDFLKRIGHLLETSTIGVYLLMDNNDSRGWQMTQQIWPLIRNNIRILYFGDCERLNGGYGLRTLDELRRNVSPTVLRECQHLQRIICRKIEDQNLLEVDDAANATSGQALLKWLDTPLANGCPKELDHRAHTVRDLYSAEDIFVPNIGIRRQIEALKVNFERSSVSASASFIVSYMLCHISHFNQLPYEEFDFEMENRRTMQQLSGQRRHGSCRYAWVVKCPIGQFEKVMKETRQMQWDTNINFSIDFRGVDTKLEFLSIIDASF